MLWSAEADTSVVVLTSVPAALPDDRNFAGQLLDSAILTDEDGTHLLQPVDGRELHLVRPPGVEADRPLAALVPLDPTGLDRLDAVDQLLRAMLGRRVSPDPRLTRQQRRRLRHMLQAVDGREQGATYREIAAVLFGAERVASDPWKTSALRDATMALVRDGKATIAGGYRGLLWRKRRA